jgi:hypothetical protein
LWSFASSTAIDLIGNSGTSYIGLDNVSVVRTSSPIPEPSTCAMMLVGFAGLAFAGYRSRRPAAAIA